jgi:hypothetical protein
MIAVFMLLARSKAGMRVALTCSRVIAPAAGTNAATTLAGAHIIQRIFLLLCSHTQIRSHRTQHSMYADGSTTPALTDLNRAQSSRQDAVER